MSVTFGREKTSPAIVTPDGKSAGFLATYYGANDPTDPSAPLLGPPQVVASAAFGTPNAGSPPSFLTTSALYPNNQWSVAFTGKYTPPVSGEYNFSVTESGTTKLYIDGVLVAQRARDDFGYVDHATVALTGGKPVSIVLDYSPEEAAAGIPPALANNFGSIFNTFLGTEVQLGVTLPPASGPTLIQQAAAAAAKADVAVVFAGREIGEGHDLETLSLPGDQNQMIQAVAAANQHTVVVLTGGPVTMPWLHRVAGVLEMWEPGATFGTAVASLLFGDSDPSGKLPITFPASDRQGSGTAAIEYPGITDRTTGTSDDYDQLEQERYDEGIDVGYRYYQTHGERPLFPFGFGLSYARFDRRIIGRWIGRDGTVTVRVADRNRGNVGGADVVEGYVHDPASTGEPPEQLRAFDKVWLEPGQTKLLTLLFRPSAFAYWDSGPATGTTPGTTSPTTLTNMPSPQPPGRWTVAPGIYRIDIGSSSQQFDASLLLRLGRDDQRHALNGLFGWRLNGGRSELHAAR